MSQFLPTVQTLPSKPSHLVVPLASPCDCQSCFKMNRSDSSVPTCSPSQEAVRSGRITLQLISTASPPPQPGHLQTSEFNSQNTQRAYISLLPSVGPLRYCSHGVQPGPAEHGLCVPIHMATQPMFSVALRMKVYDLSRLRASPGRLTLYHAPPPSARWPLDYGSSSLLC